MLQHFLHLARNSIAYLVAYFVPAFLGVLLLPLYTRFLSTDEYGITAVAESIAVFLLAFYQLGLLAAYMRFYFDYRDDPAELRRHISTIAIFVMVYGLVLSTLLTLLGSPLERLMPGVPFSPYIQMAVWSSYFNLIFLLGLNLYRTEQKSNRYLVFSAAHVAFTQLLTIFLVVVLKEGAKGYIAAILISNALFSLLSLWLLRRYLGPVFDPHKLKAGLRYGLPLVPHILGVWMFHTADRLMLTSLAGPSEAGLYAVGYRVGQGVNLIASAINFAWGPFFYSQMKDRGDAAKGEAVRFITYWVMAMCFTFVIAIIFSRELVTLLAAPEYRDCYRVVPLIALGFLFQGFYFAVVNPLFWLRKTPLIAAGTLTSGILNVVLNLVLIPHMQMMGAAVASAISNLYCFLFIAFFSLKLFPVPYEYRRLAKIGAAAAACYLLSLAAEQLSGFWVVFAAKLPIILVFPLILLGLRFLQEEERQALRRLVKAAVSRAKEKLGRIAALLGP